MGTYKKTVLKGFDYLHCDDFAAYLMQMAQRGWHFKEWSAGLVFEKGEPRDSIYAVEVFPDASEYDTRPEVNTQEFAAYCEAAGWKLIDAKRKFCIFLKVRSDAVAILTPQERLQNIAREEQKRVWQQVFINLSFLILQILQFTGSGFTNRIFSNPMLLITALWGVLGIGALVRCIHFYLWRARCCQEVECGSPVQFGSNPNPLSYLNGWLSWIGFGGLVAYVLLSTVSGQYLTLAYLAVILIPMLIMAYFIAKFRPDPLYNQLIQIAVPCIVFVLAMSLFVGIILTDNAERTTIDEIPLLYEDIGGNAGQLEEQRIDSSSSILGSGLRCWLYYEEEHIYYQVYKSDYRWVLDKIWKEEMDRKYNQLGTDVTALWNAEQAVRNTIGNYLVKLPKAVLILNLGDIELNHTQAQTVLAALYGGN